MANTRDIKRRLKSIGSTKKITKAMEMVSAAKMRKAVSQVMISREYANIAWEIMQNISKSETHFRHPLLRQPGEIKKIAILAVSSNRGLCGGFNSNLTKEVMRVYQKYNSQGVNCDFITYGQKTAREIRQNGLNIIANFTKPDLMQNIDSIDPICQILLKGFQTKMYQKVILIYTDFKSSLFQQPLAKTILPLATVADQDLGKVNNDSSKIEKTRIKVEEYKFEPSPREVLDEILPRILKLQIYQSCLESDASEHSARMVAMRNAYSAANDMIHELNLIYNKARQTAITQEIAEIVGAVSALN